MLKNKTLHLGYGLQWFEHLAFSATHIKILSS